MKWFYNLKISQKLTVTFLGVLFFICALGVFSVFQLGQVNQASTDMAANWLPSIRSLSKMGLTMSRTRSFELQQLLAADKTEQQYLQSNAKAELDLLLAQTKKYESLVSEAEEKELYPQIRKSVEDFIAIHDEIAVLAKNDRLEEARSLMKNKSTPIFRKTIDQIERLIQVNNEGADRSNSLADSIFHRAKIGIVIAIFACMIISLCFSWWISRLISRPLAEAVVLAKQVADGDLRAQINVTTSDETGVLLQSLRQMTGNLQNIVSEVRQGTETIHTASSEIAAGNLDLSARTEEQAGSLEETASAMEELTSTVRQNADNARQANQLAQSASVIAKAGGSVVNQVVETMGSIHASSQKIVDIISVIDGIAFQTNILALNAAVEAARAGEQGRGFAVVASEVRTLAQRSAAAAKEIKELIANSVEKVDAGTKLVEQAGATMSEVVDSVGRVTDIVSEISAASSEQSQGIEQINQAVTQMDEVTQQNAALVEQAAAAAKALQEQAERLTGMVGVFKVEHESIRYAAAGSSSNYGVIASPVSSRAERTRAPRLATPANASNGDHELWEQF